MPSEVTDFVDRKEEFREVKHLLSETRLLTLQGAGGTGKTRLALRVAAEVLQDFTDKVFFIQLASVHEPQLVVATIGKTLDISEVEGRPMLDLLNELLAPKQLLLVLDNVQHLLEAVPYRRDARRRASAEAPHNE